MSVKSFVEHQLIALQFIVGGVDRRRLAGGVNESAAHIHRNFDHRSKVGRIKVTHDIIVFAENKIF